MSEIEKLSKKIRKFNKDRDWEQFHNPKDFALSLSLEAAEVLEHFQWKNGKEVDEYVKNNKEEIADEIADVFVYLLELCNILGIDIIKATNKKMAKNAKKYPIQKAKGRSDKYNKL